jgi:hypothetical protein
MSIGCGKKADEEPLAAPPITQPQTANIQEELNKQEILCGTDSTCPVSLAKIVIVDKDKMKFCTGFLTKEDVIVTASSCLPERLRIKDISCEKDIFFFFAEANAKALRVGCKKILEVSQLEGKEAFLWRSDVAYIQIERKVERKLLTTISTGMNNMDKFYMWSIDQIDAHQGVIRKSDACKSIHNSYFNPLANDQSSPVMLLAGCQFSDGNGGAPVFDYRGKVRGILSRPVDKAEIDEVVSMRILEKPLTHLVHVSNFACLRLFPDQDVLNEDECNKNLDLSGHDLGQIEIINEANLFREPIKKIEHSLNEKNRYMKMEVELIASEDAYDIKVYPKCFKNVAKWVREFNNNKPFTFNIELPDMKIKKSMSEYGKISTLEIPKTPIPTNFQFKPSILRNTKKATVFVWANGPTVKYENMPECDSLL